VSFLEDAIKVVSKLILVSLLGILFGLLNNIITSKLLLSSSFTSSSLKKAWTDPPGGTVRAAEREREREIEMRESFEYKI
jgi:hypothetical protein